MRTPRRMLGSSPRTFAASSTCTYRECNRPRSGRNPVSLHALLQIEAHRLVNTASVDTTIRFSELSASGDDISRRQHDEALAETKRSSLPMYICAIACPTCMSDGWLAHLAFASNRFSLTPAQTARAAHHRGHKLLFWGYERHGYQHTADRCALCHAAQDFACSRSTDFPF